MDFRLYHCPEAVVLDLMNPIGAGRPAAVGRMLSFFGILSAT